MSLEPIIQNKVGQKDKNKYVSMESGKTELENLFAEMEWRCRHRGHTCGCSGKEKER